MKKFLKKYNLTKEEKEETKDFVKQMIRKIILMTHINFTLMYILSLNLSDFIIPIPVLDIPPSLMLPINCGILSTITYLFWKFISNLTDNFTIFWLVADICDTFVFILKSCFFGLAISIILLIFKVTLPIICYYFMMLGLLLVVITIHVKRNFVL